MTATANRANMHRFLKSILGTPSYRNSFAVSITFRVLHDYVAT